jgi:lysine 2,3-aminomutase
LKNPDLRPDVAQTDWRNWRWQFANRARTIGDLSAILDIKDDDIPFYKGLISTYRYAVTPYYLSLIDPSDPADPIKKQCLPDPKELTFRLPGSNEDPLAELRHMPVPGLIHRYPDRALVLLTNMCAMYCRHCNRKRNWRDQGERVIGRDALNRIFVYINEHTCIREVIISGGDPLLASTGLLNEVLGKLRSILHVEVIRIGTRVPAVLPMRITDKLINILSRHRPIWINTHFNHPRELTAEAVSACDKIMMAGIPVSNHTVLLKGVNDSVQTLTALCSALQRHMIRPYYLFHCDAVSGTDHFRTGIQRGIEIMDGLHGRLGGLAIPDYVVDLPEGGGKARVMPSHIISIDDNMALFKTFEGRIINYLSPKGADDAD